MQFSKTFLWVVLILIVALVAYTIGQQEKSVKKFSVGKEGVTFEFDQLKEVPQAELKQRQDELGRELENIQRNFQNKPQSSPRGATQQQYDLNGAWRSNSGLSYNIVQYGNTITIQEISPIYGVTAIGQGIINQENIYIDFVTALYMQGKGVLKIANDGRQIEGVFTNLSTGLVTTAVLYR